MSVKLALVHPESRRVVEIVDHTGLFDFNTYPTAYIKVDLEYVSPLPSTGQIYDGIKFVDEYKSHFSSEFDFDTISLTALKGVRINEVYKYAKYRVDEVSQRYSVFESKEWDTLTAESRKFMEDSTDIGPALLAKKNKRNVNIHKLSQSVTNRSDENAAWLGAVSEWRANMIDSVKKSSRKTTLGQMDLKAGFPADPE
jgi:hypothetical protein